MNKRKCYGNLNAIIFLGSLYFSLSVGETEHRTKAATEKQNDLWCYRCDTMVDGDRCQDLQDNSTSVKCNKEHKKCQVKRISMSTSTEDVTGKPKLWLLQRNCSENCEPGCIVIGERTKLHCCITCCENSLCNSGSGTEKTFHHTSSVFPFAILLVTVIRLLSKTIFYDVALKIL